MDMTDIYVTAQEWLFGYAHCGHAWHDRFEAWHGTDFNGNEVVTWHSHGLACINPACSRSCPRCGSMPVRVLPSGIRGISPPSRIRRSRTGKGAPLAPGNSVIDLTDRQRRERPRGAMAAIPAAGLPRPRPSPGGYGQGWLKQVMVMQSLTDAGVLGGAGLTARRLAGPALLGGFLGGLAMIVVMILVMGAAGMGYATPLNVGMAAFVYMITPPMSMLPALMGLMGIHLPPSAAGQVAAALRTGHLSPAMIHQLGTMLTGMHVPPATVSQLGLLMSGHASNSTVAGLMSGLSPSARAMVMSAMPVSGGQVAVGAILHFAFATFLGVVFAAIITAAAWMGVPFMRTAGGIVAAGVIGGGVVYVVNRWGLLPLVNPMMGFVPQIAFFLAHLLFGLVVGIVLAMAFRRRGVAGALPASL